jgi:ribosomal protein S18 acetylase RimI-like enzyme
VCAALGAAECPARRAIGDDARVAKTEASPTALKRESAGRYVTGDGRFTVEQASGGWMVTDAEHANELGLPLVRGPFATLADARATVEAVRSEPAPTSELAARISSLPSTPRPAPRAAKAGARTSKRGASGGRGPAEEPPEPAPARIRAWRPADGDGLRSLWASVGMGSLGDDDASLAVMARRNAGLLQVAVEGDRIVGSALGAWDGRRGWIYHVATAPDRQRSGIARRLVEAVEAGLRAVGCPKVNVIVLDTAEGAAAFWKAAGYTRLAASQYGRVLAGQEAAGGGRR